MHNKITSKQIMYTSALSIISTSLLVKQLYTITKNDAWIAVITGFMLSLLIFLIYAALARKFPDKTPVEINDAVFGSFIGKIISGIYVFYFFTIACLNTHIISNFIKAFTLPNTPMVLILFLFIAVSAWAVRKGAVNLMRYSAIIAYISIAVILINTLFLYKDIDFKNLLPSFSLPLKSYLIGTHTIAMLPLCDSFFLLMFLPDMHRPREFGKAITKGLIIGAAVLLFVVIRDITVLGGEIVIKTFPTFTTIRNINIGDIITRMDIIYISLLLLLMFYQVSVHFMASITCFQRLMRFKSYQFLIYIFSALLILYTLSVFRAVSEHERWLNNGSAVFFQTFFLVILPLMTLIIAACRGFYRKRKAAA